MNKKAANIKIYLNNKLIDETLIANPPVPGAKIYAGKPGQVLKVVSIEIEKELCYIVKTIKV